MVEADKGQYQLTIRGISRAAAKRMAEDWAGGEMMWDNGVAYPSSDDHPCVIEVMKCQPTLTLCPTCNNDFRKCTAMTPNVRAEATREAWCPWAAQDNGACDCPARPKGTTPRGVASRARG